MTGLLGFPIRLTCGCRTKYCQHYRTIRAECVPYVAAGLVNCWRCGQLIAPGQPMDLGHDDADRKLLRGPEHRAENRATSGRANAQATRERRKTKADNRWTL